MTTEWIEASARHGVRKPFKPDTSLRFGLFWPYSRTPIPSALVAARNPDVMDLGNHVRLARAVEKAGLDFALLHTRDMANYADHESIGPQVPCRKLLQHIGG